MSIAQEADKAGYTTGLLAKNLVTCCSNQKDRAKENKSNFQNLPPDLVEKIQYRLGPDDLLASSQASKYMRLCSVSALRASCEASGLVLPHSGASTYAGLLALSRGTARRLRDGALEGEPTWTYQCRNRPSDDHVFPCGAFQHVSAGGIYVDGVERLRIELPSMGSDAGVKICCMDQTGNALEGSDYAGLATSDGHVLYGRDLRVFVNMNDANAYAKVTPPKPVYCAAAYNDTLATGHEDCVRLWSLPDLVFKGELNSDSICRLRWSPGGDYLVGSDLCGHSLAKMWKLPEPEAIWSMEGENFEFDSKQGDLVFAMKYHDGTPLGDLLVTLSPHSLTTRTQRVSRSYITSINAMPGRHILVDADDTIHLVSSDPFQPDVVLAEHKSFGDQFLGDITMSNDGRWLVLLLTKGDIQFWDLSAQRFF